MSDQFLAEIRIFPGNFAPKGWAFCNGQIMPLSQNTALFSLLGTTYGGDGKSTFALPDLRARAPMHWGQGPGLSLHDQGEMGGESTVTLTAAQVPSHSHTLRATSDSATAASPGRSTLLGNSGSVPVYSNTGGSPLAPRGVLNPAGSGLAHNNLPPYLALNFCIALQGEYPQRA